MTGKPDRILELPVDYPPQREVSFNGYGVGNPRLMWHLIAVAAVFFAIGCTILIDAVTKG